MHHQVRLAPVVASLALFLLGGCQDLPDNRLAGQAQVTEADYRRAEQFLPDNLRPLVKNSRVEPHWIDDSSRFWFRQQLAGDGQRFVLVDPEANTQTPAFDHQAMARALRQQGVDVADGDHLPFTEFDWQGAEILVTLDGRRWQCRRVEPVCTQMAVDSTEPVNDAGVSPDGRWRLRVQDYNLVLESLDGGQTTVLTRDGSEGYAYGVIHPNPKQQFSGEAPADANASEVFWSPDSRYVITHRLNRQQTGKLTLVQSTTGEGYRPKAVSYYYPAGGDAHIPMADVILVDVRAGKAIALDTPPVMQTYYGGPLWGWWQENNRFVFHDRVRGNRRYFMREVNPETAGVRTLVEERDDRYIDPWVQEYWSLPRRGEFIWSSQREGYQHLYRYDSTTGQLKNAITRGEMTVRVIRAVDENKGQLYFEASGREPGRDPYYRHLYRVNLDGTGLVLLTPEAAEHDTRISPDHRFVIDTYSTATTPPVSVLRSTEDGRVVRELLRADVSALMATGWQPPQPFEALAADGKTPVYGLMYLPSDFDPEKRYPIIDDIYTGPHNFFTPKSFHTYGRQAPALAELGFVVIKMDGRGTNKRGRAFHEYSFKNLGGGSDDHVAAIRQLAGRYRYLDGERVGIFGFSAGGYDTAHAMFKYPGFFKVGVSASGNHDFRTDKTGWNEMWMGYPVTPEWDAQSNLAMADKLQGKLLLAHGELDDNVHPAATLQLVDALIKANKDFDLKIYPNMGHVLDRNAYFVRQRWDYFVRHLLGAEPPKEYRIAAANR